MFVQCRPSARAFSSGGFGGDGGGDGEGGGGGLGDALARRRRGRGGGGERREARGESAVEARRRQPAEGERALVLAVEVLAVLVEVMATVMTAMADSGWGGEGDATTSATRRLFTSERVPRTFGDAGEGRASGCFV